MKKIIIITLTFCFIIMAIPILFESLYYIGSFNEVTLILSFREYLKFIFASKDVLWIVITGIITAFGICISLIIQKSQQDEELKLKKENLLIGLKNEIRLNLNSMFSPLDTNLNVELDYYTELKLNFSYLNKYESNTLWTFYSIFRQYKYIYELLLNSSEKLQSYYQKKLQLMDSILGFYEKSKPELLSEIDESKVVELKKSLNMPNTKDNKKIIACYTKVLTYYSEFYLKNKELFFEVIDSYLDKVVQK